MISGPKDTIILIPGWATDCRIFKTVESSKIFKEKPADKISLLGWSLGGFMAAGFAFKNPDTIGGTILGKKKAKNEPPTPAKTKTPS